MSSSLRHLPRILLFRHKLPGTGLTHFTAHNFFSRVFFSPNRTLAHEAITSCCRRYSTDQNRASLKDEETQDSQKDVEISAEPEDGGQCVDDDFVPSINYEPLFKEIAAGDEGIEKQLKVLEFEIAVFRERLANVPKVLNKKHWLELLTLPSFSAKKKYLNFLFGIEKSKENRLQRKQQKKLFKQLAWEKQCEHHHMEYGLNTNALFLRIYAHTIVQMLDHRSMAAEMFENHIVFDCSYGEHMGKLNQKFCAKQLFYCYNINRIHPAPFHLKFCNFNSSEIMSEHLCTLLNTTPESLPMDISTTSYLDYYPKERLVYLTPHCKETLLRFNPDDIYIVGAFVDKGCGEKVSLGKARAQKLRMAKFPIDQYLNWQKGAKSLPLNTVLSILLDFRYHNSWEMAFRNIARRNLYSDL